MWSLKPSSRSIYLPPPLTPPLRLWFRFRFRFRLRYPSVTSLVGIYEYQNKYSNIQYFLSLKSLNKTLKTLTTVKQRYSITIFVRRLPTVKQLYGITIFESIQLLKSLTTVKRLHACTLFW